jgi:hypothetical protein
VCDGLDMVTARLRGNSAPFDLEFCMSDPVALDAPADYWNVRTCCDKLEQPLSLCETLPTVSANWVRAVKAVGETTRSEKRPAPL